MKIQKYHIIAIAIAIVVIYNSTNDFRRTNESIIIEQEDMDLAEYSHKLSFQLGAAYAMRAQDDARYYECQNVEDFINLAWKIYEADNYREEMSIR